MVLELTSLETDGMRPERREGKLSLSRGSRWRFSRLDSVLHAVALLFFIGRKETKLKSFGESG